MVNDVAAIALPQPRRHNIMMHDVNEKETEWPSIC
jgi:hypothetical protein